MACSPIALRNVMKFNWNPKSIKSWGHSHSICTHVVKAEPVTNAQLWHGCFTNSIYRITCLTPYDGRAVFQAAVSWNLQRSWNVHKVVWDDIVKWAVHSIIDVVHEGLLSTDSCCRSVAGSVEHSLSNDIHSQHMSRAGKIVPYIWWW